MFLKDLIIGLKFTAVTGILAHIIGESLPRRWFKASSFPFKAFAWERNGLAYSRLHPSKLAKKLPDMSKIIPYMFRKKLSQKMPPEDIKKFIQETCVAEAIHEFLILLSPILTFIVEGKTGMLFAFIYFFCNLPFIVIQRYNRPRLQRIYERQIMRKKSEQEEAVNCEGINPIV